MTCAWLSSKRVIYWWQRRKLDLLSWTSGRSKLNQRNLGTISPQCSRRLLAAILHLRTCRQWPGHHPTLLLRRGRDLAHTLYNIRSRNHRERRHDGRRHHLSIHVNGSFRVQRRIWQIQHQQYHLPQRRP